MSAPHQPPSSPPPTSTAIVSYSACFLCIFCFQCLHSATHFVSGGLPALTFPTLALLFCILLRLSVHSQRRSLGDFMVDPHNSCRRNEFKSRRGISSSSFQSALLKFGRGIWPLQLWVLVYAKHIHVVSSVPILLVSTRESQSAALLTCPTANHALNLSLSMAPAASKAHPPGCPNVSAKAPGMPQEPRHTSTAHPAATGEGSGEWVAVGVATAPGMPQEPRHQQPQSGQPQSRPPPPENGMPQRQRWKEAKAQKCGAGSSAVSLTASESARAPIDARARQD